MSRIWMALKFEAAARVSKKRPLNYGFNLGGAREPPILSQSGDQERHFLPVLPSDFLLKSLVAVVDASPHHFAPAM